MISDAASVGTVGGPERNVPKQTQKSGSSPGLMRTRSIFPCPRYTPYGARASFMGTVVRRVTRGCAQVST